MKKIALLIIATGLATSAYAQRAMSRDTIRGAVVEVYQTYTPEIKLAPKTALTPTLPPVDTARAALSYDVPQQTLHYTYRSLPLRPLALGRDTAPLQPQNFIRVGAGSRSTAFGEVGIGSLQNRFFSSTIYGRHLSQNGPLRYQTASNTEARVDVESRVFPQHILTGSLSATHDRYGYYGYDRERLPGTIDLSRIRYTGVRTAFRLDSDSVAALGFKYGIRAGASLYGNDAATRERSLNLAVNGSYSLEEAVRVTVEVATALTSLHRFDGGRESNNWLALRPAIHYTGRDVSGRAGLYPTVALGGTLYLLPDLLLKYRIPETPVHLSAGWEASLWQNTFEQLSTRNPFVDPNFPLRQTRGDDVYGRVDAALGKHFSVSAKGGWRRWLGLPLFVNRYDNTSFLVVHDGRVEAVQVEGSVRYAVGESFSVGASAAYTNFYEKSFARVWHEPGFRLSADATARPVRGLTVGASLAYLDRIAAPDRDGRAVWLKPVADFGLRGEYDLTEHFGVFARIDNLFNNRYERWRGYPSFGFALWGGLRYKF